MIEDGDLQAFRTRGGHLRVRAESLKAIRGEAQRAVPSAVPPSSNLQSRRERIEELNLEAQELRAQRQLDALRREHENEEAEREEEEEALRQEYEGQAQAELAHRRSLAQREQEEFERHQIAQEEREQREQFVSSWLEVGLKEIPEGVPAALRLEVTEQLIAALENCRFRQRDLISQMVSAKVADGLAPWYREQQIAEIVEEACKTLPFPARGFSWSPTEWDLKAQQAALAAIADLKDTATLAQIRAAANLAVKPVVREFEAHENHRTMAQQKEKFLDRWFLRDELSRIVSQLLTEDVIELEPGETVLDVASGLEVGARRQLDERLSGAETCQEVAEMLSEFARSKFGT